MSLTPPPSAPPAAPTAPGDAPSRANPSTFRALADAFVAWQATFRDSLADLRTWLADYITWAGTNVTELDALQSDVTEKANTATTKASDASDSADAASDSASAAADSRAAIDNRLYPGTYASDPTTRPDGSSIQEGDEYTNSTVNLRKVYAGGVWIVPEINAGALAASSGASLVGDGDTTVADRLSAINLADYTALRAYAGSNKSAYITGFLVSAAPSGIAGLFTRDDSDTTSADNGGTIIVASNGKRWKRAFNGAVDLRWFGVKGASAAVDTPAIQAAIDYLESIGGGELGWCDAVVNGAITIQCSDITIRPLAGSRLEQTSSYNTFRIYPTSLNSIWDGSGRPAGFENGIDGAPELLMYESDDTKRLRNVQILDLDFQYTGAGAYGRFLDAFSVDHMVVRGCKAVSGSNAVNLWYCRDAEVAYNDLTTSSSSFDILLFKSYGEVAYNTVRNGVHGIEAKGTYPRAGKTVLQAFDAGYEFAHPLRIHHNRIYETVDYGIQCGYYDNSTADISSGTPVGVTKSQWYGEMWCVEMCDNTIIISGTLGVQKAGIRLNVNSRYMKVERNFLVGAGIIVFGACDNDICDNTLVDHRATSTAAIELAGFITGAVARNCQRNKVARNRIRGHARTAIFLRGCDYVDVVDNQVDDGTAGFVQIDCDSSNSASTSVGNQILRNRINCTAADFSYPIRSRNASGTVIDQNRAYGGWYSGNALDSDGFADAHYKRGVVSADTATSSVGAAGTCYVGQNYGDQNATTSEVGYAAGMALNGFVGCGWRQPVIFGVAFLWPTAAGVWRTKLVSAGKPTGDTDGAVVGTQS